MKLERLLMQPRTFDRFARMHVLLSLSALAYLAASVIAGRWIPGDGVSLAILLSVIIVACLGGKRSERGIWMLCALWLALWIPLLGMFLIGIETEASAGRISLRALVEGHIACLWCASSLWAILSFGYWNWRRFRGPAHSGGGPPRRPPPEPTPVLAPKPPRIPRLSAHAVPEDARRTRRAASL
jgi:hypothetical protein